MMLYLTDANNNQKIAINTDHIVAVHKSVEGENATGKTIVNLTNSHLFVLEEDYEIVSMINNG